MSECHKKAWNRQAQRRRGGERGGWRDLRRQTTDKKILSGKKGVFSLHFRFISFQILVSMCSV